MRENSERNGATSVIAVNRIGYMYSNGFEDGTLQSIAGQLLSRNVIGMLSGC